MPNQLSNEMLAEMFDQVSGDPFLMLMTLSHESFNTIHLVNNTVDIESRGNTHKAFPMKVILPVDDGETAKTVDVTFDNVSRELIDELRSITTPIDVKVEMILASNPDSVQVSLEELKLSNIIYDESKIKGTLTLDDFLNVGMTSEKYVPTKYPGLF